jgi:hypothetical protein
MKKYDKNRLIEVMSRLDKTFKPKLNEDINSTETNDSYDRIINEFPGHAKYVNPVDSPQYKWYLRALSFIQGNNDISEKAELVKFFQNNFFGIDYGEFNTPEELVAWWLSPEEQKFITDEMNAEGSNNELNETTDDIFPITVPIGSEDDKLFTSIVNQGIDSHLEGFTKSKFGVKGGERRVFNFDKSELPILLRRLEELGTEEALQWKNDIETYDANLYETMETVANESNQGFKRMTIFLMYDKNGSYLGDLAPIDEQERASEFYENSKSEVLATPEFQKFAQEKNITPDQIGRIKKDYEYTMNGNPLSFEYYAASDSEELYDSKTKTWYNRSGQQLRNPEEYDKTNPEWTPFGDEGDNY